MKDTKAQMKSMMIFAVVAILCLFSVYAVTITLNHPSDEWITSNSVPLNFTLTTLNDTVPYCAVYTNESGAMVLKANYSNIANGTSIKGVVINDSTDKGYGWNITCLEGVKEFYATATNFGVDGSTPSITLDSPSSETWDPDNSMVLKFTPTDSSNLEQCALWINHTGSWAVNTTISVTTGTQYDIQMNNTADGSYKWNVNCTDEAGNMDYAIQNFTYHVDATAPADIKITTPTNNTENSDFTPYIAWNQTTEANFEDYQVWVSTNADVSSPFQIKTVTSRTTNYTTLDNLPNNGTYYIKVIANDKAGNQKNTTVLYYILNASVPIVTLNYPTANTFTNDNTPDFNVTVTDAQPDSCVLLLSKPSGSTVYNNVTVSSITTDTEFNLTFAESMADGVYKFNVECNDTQDNRVNVSSSLVTLTVDTTYPLCPNITSQWVTKNNTDLTPELRWGQVTEANFSRYEVFAYYKDNNSVAYSTNVTTQTTTYASLDLNVEYSYNFSVIAYDLAGNSNNSKNVTESYVDSVCGTLASGWNLCGATWTTPKSLSLIGNETGAYFVTVWNQSHAWQTCNHAASATGTYCDVEVGIANNTIHAVWLYMNSSTNWRNRTWEADATSADIFLSNTTNVVGSTNGWNIEASFIRNGLDFRTLGVNMGGNATMFSLPWNNATSTSYVNSGYFVNLNNATNFGYGRAMWIYYNGTAQQGNMSYNVGGW